VAVAMKLFQFAVAAVFAATVHAQSLETIHRWPTPGIAGDPRGPLLPNGADIFGVTGSGGSSNGGFIFRINGGTLTKIRDFDQGGWVPFGGLTLASDGNYYGTTFAGGLGSFAGFPGTGNGTIFRLTPAGVYSTLFNFSGGGNPLGELVEISPMVFVGVAQDVTNNFGGSVFKIDLTSGFAFSLLKSLNANNDGRIRHGIAKGSDGRLYGAADRVVFGMDADGQNYTELRRVASSTDASGFGFSNGVTEGADGRLYGIAHSGGANNKGVVYRLDKSGANFAALHHFSGPDGAGATSNRIRGRLVAHSDGALYGGTSNGGSGDSGTLFKITTDGVFTKLADFAVGGPAGLVESAGRLLVTTDNASDSGVRGHDLGRAHADLRFRKIARRETHRCAAPRKRRAFLRHDGGGRAQQSRYTLAAPEYG
jgi:uncharacterized repeat protein (TIGR03803 family)